MKKNRLQETRRDEMRREEKRREEKRREEKNPSFCTLIGPHAAAVFEGKHESSDRNSDLERRLAEKGGIQGGRRG